MDRITISGADFAADAVAADTRMVNQAVIRALSAIANRSAIPPAIMRQARLEGRGPFPLPPESRRAREEMIEGPHGPILLRIYWPEEAPKGVYLHFHGGGWCIGSPRENDSGNDRIVARTGYAVVSVRYRLAPEHPYPQGPDDCEAAALWLAKVAQERFGTDRLVIGGESAGACLAAAVLVRLRDRHGVSPFRGALLTAGCFDLRLTPSVRRWGETPLVLNTRDIENFVAHYLAGGGGVEDPDVSPLLADLSGLPPALFAVGTQDPLLDDTLFMSARWLAAGNAAELIVAPGGAHVFNRFPGSAADAANARADAFLDGL
ncbi:alpha/beta hydrolase [Aquabacter cavernae]|uniref:alpha/beta hydrolase n=1 Tax=Aquabacter cavernae TaxID=2496029 RepID=UPI000F8DFD03|nr:alpha/beta hydrolase [Aquabacter cavernae]